MTSSIWVSVNQMIAAREAQIIDDNNKQIPSEAVLTELQANSTEASVRWAIVIGKDGETLKLIGSNARRDIERARGRKVFLKLWCRVKENWSDDPKALSKFGYSGGE